MPARPDCPDQSSNPGPECDRTRSYGVSFLRKAAGKVLSFSVRKPVESRKMLVDNAYVESLVFSKNCTLYYTLSFFRLAIAGCRDASWQVDAAWANVQAASTCHREYVEYSHSMEWPIVLY